ncbi:unnamed protein product [Vitrella brassicaformis CCMP3155]|uniref:Uncharacterized protein n=1 Tax=Vitrella brassicaformis (strain CCMP3155) TaxID=1169540 RepID=A0A0G4GSB0_VITBC|nr:unnamed protein product [Vitrella brassicaformis CCMP3155]|eukprot:CEM33513.1 unnamed protein product [Vitrella brassicaformis CCMP3155]
MELASRCTAVGVVNNDQMTPLLAQVRSPGMLEPPLAFCKKPTQTRGLICESWAAKISGLSEPVHLKALPSVPCNITGGSWQQGPSMPYPYYWDHAALMAQGKIYAVGGYIGSEGRAMDQIRVFDPETSEWTDLSPLPEARHHVMASVDLSPADDAFVIVGGIDGELGDHATASAWLYNITTDTIMDLPDMPKTRAAGAAVTLDGLI